MSKFIRVKFVQLSMNNNRTTFEDCLKYISETAPDKRCKHTGQGWHVSITKINIANEFGQKNRFIDGDVQRLKMDDLPGKGSTQGDDTDLPIDDHEGVTDHTAFRYDKITKVLAYQLKGGTVPLKRFLYYVENFNNLDYPLTYQEILPLEALRRLARLDKANKFKLVIGGNVNAKAFEKLGLSSSHILKLGELFANEDRPRVTVDLSLDMRRSAALNLKRIASYSKKIYAKSRESDLQKIEVSGTYTDKDGMVKKDDFNLMDLKLVDSTPIPEYNGRRMPYYVRRDALETLFDNHLHQLETMFSK